MFVGCRRDPVSTALDLTSPRIVLNCTCIGLSGVRLVTDPASFSFHNESLVLSLP